jgi:hypothetical protein
VESAVRTTFQKEGHNVLAAYRQGLSLGLRVREVQQQGAPQYQVDARLFRQARREEGTLHFISESAVWHALQRLHGIIALYAVQRQQVGHAYRKHRAG